MDGFGIVDPGPFAYMLHIDTGNERGSIAVPGLSRKVVNPTSIERQKVEHAVKGSELYNTPSYSGHRVEPWSRIGAPNP